jgi:hypothetical protein
MLQVFASKNKVDIKKEGNRETEQTNNDKTMTNIYTLQERRYRLQSRKTSGTIQQSLAPTG